MTSMPASPPSASSRGPSSAYLSEAALAAVTRANPPAGRNGSAKVPGRERHRADDDEHSDSTDLSSAPSMSRQMTEVSEVQCREVLERQCSGFQTRGTEFWIRQNTTPAKRQTKDAMEGLRRQLSAPVAAAISIGRGAAGRLEAIIDSDVNSESTGPSRQASQRTDAENMECQDGLIEVAICTVITECNFSVCVSDPNSLDSELIAVSAGFCRLTGYAREDVIGENCRFLNKGCEMPEEQRTRLFEAVESGAPFTGVIVNKKKSGELFLNLLDLRGLVVARNARTSEDIWILLAVQSDVTGMDQDRLPESHSLILRQVASRIRKRLQKQLAELGLAGAMVPASLNSSMAEEPSAPGGMRTKDSWFLMSDVCWRPGEHSPLAVQRSLEDLPDLVDLRGRLEQDLSIEPPPRSQSRKNTRNLEKEAASPDAAQDGASAQKASPVPQDVVKQNPFARSWLAHGVVPVVGILVLALIVWRAKRS